MSATIYVKSTGDDFNFEELEFIHRFSDQARVWAYLLYKEAGLIQSYDEWMAKRSEWRALLEELRGLDSSYSDLVLAALRQPYLESQGEKSFASSKDASNAVIPPYAGKDTDATKVAELVKKIQELMTDLYPSRGKVGFKGPFLSESEMSEVVSTPQDITELKEYAKNVGNIDPAKLSGITGINMLDMMTGFYSNYGIPDPEEFATKALHRAMGLTHVKAYNPHQSEDLGVGYEGRKAKIGTFIYRVMMNDIMGYVKTHKFKKEVSMSESVGDEGDLTVEEGIAEPAAKEQIFDWSDPKVLKDLREYLEVNKKAAGSKLTDATIDRIIDIYKMKFIDFKSDAEIASHFGYEKRDRNKEIAEMRRLKLPVDKLPGKTHPVSNPPIADQVLRDKMWVEYLGVPPLPPEKGKDGKPDQSNVLTRIIRNIDQQLKAIKDPSSPEAISLKKKLDEAKGIRSRVTAPNTVEIRDDVTGEHPEHKGPYLFEFFLVKAATDAVYEPLVGLIEAWKLSRRQKKQQDLETLLESISILRKEGSLNYNLLRNKIEQRLTAESPQLFTVYSYLYESNFSNPDTARIMKLSPPRITGLKKKIVSTLLDLPEIENLFNEAENGSTSPLRRLIFKEGDSVRVLSINEAGTISGICSNGWYDVRLDNGNDVFTVKADLRKYCTLVDSTNNVLGDYFGKEVVTPQCYLSLLAGVVPRLVVLELRPSSAISTTARLHINNNLVDVTEISEEYPDNLISLLKGHIGLEAAIDTPFTTLFEEVE